MHPLYPLGRAARYWGVPPWELFEQGDFWMSLGLAFEQAESRAVEIAHEIEKAKDGDGEDDEDEEGD